MAVTLSRLAIDLLINATGLEKGLGKAMRTTRKFGRELSAVGRDLTAKVTAPIAGIGFASLKVAGDFQAAMNRVRALTGATGEQFDALREKAKELGATTQFSATESAAGIEMLSKNGLKYEAIMGGALDATLKLSAATGSDLARAADIGTDAMLAFGIEAGRMEEAVNAITGVTLNSKFDIEGYALALANGGAVASAAGVSFNEFNAAIAAMAPSFSSGQTAGTSFKTFLTRLTPSTAEAEKAMQKLGLKFFDAEGQMKNISDIAGQLQTAFAGLSEADRIDLAKDIFGTEGANAAFALAKAGREELERLNQAILATSASEQAEARLQGLNGALTKLRSALEAAGIAIAESGLLDKATKLIEKLTEIFSGLAKTNPKILQIGVAIATAAAAIGPALLVLGNLATGLSAILALIGGKAGLIAVFGALTGPIGLTVAAISGLTLAYVTYKDEIDAFLSGTWNRLKETWEMLPIVIEVAGDALSKWFSAQMKMLVDLAQRWETAKRNVVDAVKAMVSGIWDQLVTRLSRITDRVKGTVESISNKFRWLTDKVVGNSWVPDMVDGIAREEQRLVKVFRDPILKQNDDISASYHQMAGSVNAITLEPKTLELDASQAMETLAEFQADLERIRDSSSRITLELPTPDPISLDTSEASASLKSFQRELDRVKQSSSRTTLDLPTPKPLTVDASPARQSVENFQADLDKVKGVSNEITLEVPPPKPIKFDHPFIFGTTDQSNVSEALREHIQKPLEESIGRPRFQTRKAAAAISEAAEKIGRAAQKPFSQSIGEMESKFTGLGHSIADSLLGMNGTLEDGSASFKDWGKGITGVMESIVKAFRGLNGSAADTSKGLTSLFGGLQGSFAGFGAGGSASGIFGGLGTIFNPDAGASGASSGDIVGSVLSGIGSLFGGFFADGGVAPAGRLSVVGERGPELLLPRNNTAVVPFARIPTANAAAGRPAINITLETTNTFNGTANREEMEEMIARSEERTIAAIPEAVRRGGGYRRAIQG